MAGAPRVCCGVWGGAGRLAAEACFERYVCLVCPLPGAPRDRYLSGGRSRLNSALTPRSLRTGGGATGASLSTGFYPRYGIPARPHPTARQAGTSALPMQWDGRSVQPKSMPRITL